MKEQYQKLLDLVRQNYASVVWTHKIQEQQAEIYEEKYKLIETINIFSAALTSCGIFSTFYQDKLWIKVITILLSFTTLFITAYLKSFDLKSMAKENKDYANRFLVVRNKMLSIIAEIHMMKKPADEIQEKYELVMSESNEIFISAPATNNKAVTRAKKRLEVDKDYTFTEGEIDRFLPESLKGNIKA
ncbi:MAG: SLATT domain-containing protein [Eubacterium sp.]|nr:SLATT domain-containing protein [Eubacterium sp.]